MIKLITLYVKFFNSLESRGKCFIPISKITQTNPSFLFVLGDSGSTLGSPPGLCWRKAEGVSCHPHALSLLQTCKFPEQKTWASLPAGRTEDKPLQLPRCREVMFAVLVCFWFESLYIFMWFFLKKISKWEDLIDFQSRNHNISVLVFFFQILRLIMLETKLKRQIQAGHISLLNVR